MFASEQQVDIVLGAGRRIILPKALCDRLGLKVGSQLELTLEGTALVLRAKNTAGLEALQELQRTVAESGVTAEALVERAGNIRKRVYEEHYGTGD